MSASYHVALLLWRTQEHIDDYSVVSEKLTMVVSGVVDNNPIMQKLGHNNFHVGLDTQPARTPGLVLASWSQEVKLDREFEESSSIASGYGAHLSVDAFVLDRLNAGSRAPRHISCIRTHFGTTCGLERIAFDFPGGTSRTAQQCRHVGHTTPVRLSSTSSCRELLLTGTSLGSL